MNCLGNIFLDKGHSLDPTPPAITTGSIIEFTKITSSLILTKKVIINNNYLAFGCSTTSKAKKYYRLFLRSAITSQSCLASPGGEKY